MKRILAVLTLSLALLALFASCTGKTPDVIAAEEAAEVNIKTVTWTLEIEGAEKTSYTRAEAETHDLSKIFTSIKKHVENDANGVGAMQTTIRVDGIPLHVMLEDLGRADAKKLTCYGTDTYGNPAEFTVEGDLLQSDEVLLGWIMNKDQILYDSKSYVGILASTTAAPDFPYCTSVTKIVIE